MAVASTSAQRAPTQSRTTATTSSPTEALIRAELPESNADQRTAEADLQARRVALQLAAWPAPAAPQLLAVTPSPLPIPFVGRWAVQVLAGPALTYRRLNAAPQNSPSNSAGQNFSAADLIAANGVAALERPALGGGAQVSVRRSLGKRWSLSAGLGYSEYASGLALQQVHTLSNQIPPSQDSTTTRIHRRDTYRFVTLPVRVGYAWTLSGRWRVGVLAGAEAAFYVGGNTTEGSACACQTQTWGASGSPYRPISVGASLGAEVRYRLTDRWELLAQPTATYLLTPLARPTAALYERNLFGGTALLGVSYDLP